jgi:O-antigen/teichoic acid export membrane protein
MSKTFGAFNLINATFAFGISALLISVFAMTWEGRVLGLLLGECLTLVCRWFFGFSIIRTFKFHITKSSYLGFISFGAPLMLALVGGWLMSQLDRFIVLKYFSLAEVGFYTAALSVGSVITIVNQAAGNAILPSLYSSLRENKGEALVRKINILYSIAILLLATCIAFGSLVIVPLVLDEKYQGIEKIVFILAYAYSFNGIYRTTGGVIAYYKENNSQMIILFIGAAVNVVVALIGIHFLGLIGPAVGTLFSYIVLSIVSYLVGMSILKKKSISFRGVSH